MNHYFIKFLAVCCLLATLVEAHIRIDCDDLKVSYCKVNGQTIDENGFGEIFSNLPTLKIFDSYYPRMSRGLLEVFPSLNRLYIINSGVKEFAVDTFSKNVDLLEVLNFEQNDIRVLPNKMLYGAKYLISLDFGTNQIEEIGPNAFEWTPALKKLNLESNNIVKLSDGLLDPLVNLTTINLSFNRIESIPIHFFLKNTKLISIRLENNRIRNIYPSEFYHLKNIIDFNIQHNPLIRYVQVNAPNVTMPGVGAVGAFIGDVLNYDVHNNEIYYIVVDTADRTQPIRLNFCRNFLSDLKNISKIHGIESADFSYNLLTTVNFRHFAISKKIVSLYLNNNEIKYIIPNDLPFSHLEVLDLSNNYITRLSKTFLVTIPHVHEFCTDNNQLTSFDIKEIGGPSFFENLKILGITNNKWNCNTIRRIVQNFKHIEFKNIASGTSFTEGLGCTYEDVEPNVIGLTNDIYYRTTEIDENWKNNIDLVRVNLQFKFTEELTHQFDKLIDVFNKKFEYMGTNLGGQCGCCLDEA